MQPCHLIYSRFRCPSRLAVRAPYAGQAELDVQVLDVSVWLLSPDQADRRTFQCGFNDVSMASEVRVSLAGTSL